MRLDRQCGLASAHLHVPEGEARFGTDGTDPRRAPPRRAPSPARAFVAAAEHPPGSLGICVSTMKPIQARATRARTFYRILLDDGVERLARFPVFAPPRLVAEDAELQPDVIEIDLPEEESRVVVLRHALAAHERRVAPTASRP